MTFGMAALINLHVPIVNNNYDAISLIVALYCLVIFLTFPIICFFLLLYKQCTRRWYVKDFNELYNGLNHNFASRQYYCLFLSRRFIICISIFMTHYGPLQLVLLTVSVLYELCYIYHVDPF